jgi:hypothetical protein
VAQLRKAVTHGGDLPEKIPGGDDDATGAAVGEYVLDLGRRQRRVDRDGDGADAQQGVVGQEPLGPVFREDGDAVALLDPGGPPGQRELRDSLEDALRVQSARALRRPERNRVGLVVIGDGLKKQAVERADQS